MIALAVVFLVIIFFIASLKFKVSVLYKKLANLNKQHYNLTSQRYQLQAEKRHLESNNKSKSSMLNYLTEKLNDNLKSFKEASYKQIQSAVDSTADNTHKYSQQGYKNLQDFIYQLKKIQSEISTSTQSHLKEHAKFQDSIQSVSEKIISSISTFAQDQSSAAKAGMQAECKFEGILNKMGMEKNRDYFTQYPVKGGRLDFLINLDNNKQLIVDSKATIASNVGTVKHIKDQIDNLAKKKYYTKLDNAIDITALFFPFDCIIEASNSYTKEILGYAMAKRILILTPSITQTGIYIINRTTGGNVFNKDINKISNQIVQKLGSICKEYMYINKRFNDIDKSINKINSDLETTYENISEVI